MAIDTKLRDYLKEKGINVYYKDIKVRVSRYAPAWFVSRGTQVVSLSLSLHLHTEAEVIMYLSTASINNRCAAWCTPIEPPSAFHVD